MYHVYTLCWTITFLKNWEKKFKTSQKSPLLSFDIIVKNIPYLHFKSINIWSFEHVHLETLKPNGLSLRDALRKSTNIDNAKVQWSALICSWFGTPNSKSAGNLILWRYIDVDVIGTSVVCILMNKNKCRTGSLDNSYAFNNIK